VLELTGPAATTLAAAARAACGATIAPRPVDAQLAGLPAPVAGALRRVLEVFCAAGARASWNGMEESGVEWNGVEYQSSNRMEWNGMEWNRIE